MFWNSEVPKSSHSVILPNLIFFLVLLQTLDMDPLLSVPYYGRTHSSTHTMYKLAYIYSVRILPSIFCGLETVEGFICSIFCVEAVPLIQSVCSTFW